MAMTVGQKAAKIEAAFQEKFENLVKEGWSCEDASAYIARLESQWADRLNRFLEVEP